MCLGQFEGPHFGFPVQGLVPGLGLWHLFFSYSFSRKDLTTAVTPGD